MLSPWLPRPARPRPRSPHPSPPTSVRGSPRPCPGPGPQPLLSEMHVGCGEVGQCTLVRNSGNKCPSQFFKNAKPVSGKAAPANTGSVLAWRHVGQYFHFKKAAAVADVIKQGVESRWQALTVAAARKARAAAFGSARMSARPQLARAAGKLSANGREMDTPGSRRERAPRAAFCAGTPEGLRGRGQDSRAC